ncbi:LysR family transcriptional regulator [Streptomyces sp. NBC_00885]|uniref:LysR family transcriptional regulator n=1 Tax=Streptomyces sp. NBC_00885 TaxID=2975857 RepID=UPI00386A726D|nr:LysR family transcriptional regulator [Streptomyces sp. NBC_00885]
MDIRQLTTFQMAATLLSFSRAAAELNYAQSSVTGQIRGLENSLGVELFERLSGRSVRLTQAGQRFLPYAEQLLHLADEARNATKGGTEPSGRLLVGTMESIATYHMPPLLEFFHHRYPGLQVVLRPGAGAETVQALRQGSLDLGLLTDVETGHAGTDGVVLRSEPVVAVAAPGHAPAGRRLVTADQLRDVRVLAPEAGPGYRRLLERELWGGRGPTPLLESGTVESAKRWAASGLGIALLPAVAVEEGIDEGTLVPLAWWPPCEVHTQLVWRRGTRLTREMRLFIDKVSEFMAEESDQIAA